MDHLRAPVDPPAPSKSPGPNSDAVSHADDAEHDGSTVTLVDPPSPMTLPTAANNAKQGSAQFNIPVPSSRFAAPQAWRHLWPARSQHAATPVHAAPVSPAADSHYIAIPSYDHAAESGSDSDHDDQPYHRTFASRRRRRHGFSKARGGWRTCGLLVLALLLLKSLALLALLAAILFTLGPLARRHHTGNDDDTGRVAQLEINHVHVHNWTLDAFADPVANVDLSAKMLVANGGCGADGHDAWWAKWVKWVDGHVEVGEAVYDIWLENPLQSVDHATLANKVVQDINEDTQDLPSLVSKVLADILAPHGEGNNNDDNPHEPITPGPPLLIGTATVPAFRPRLSTKLIDASIRDTTIALDPNLVFKWLSPIVNLGSEAPPMKLRLVGSPKVSVGWVGKPVKVSGLATVDSAAAFRASYDWKAEDIRFDPGTLLARNTIKSTAALLATNDKSNEDDNPPVPVEYLLHFTLTFVNPHPFSLQLPLALSLPMYSHDEHDNDPLAHLVGTWLDAPGLTIPTSANGQRTKMPMTLRIPTAKMPKVFNMLQQYHRGERVSIQLGPGTQMTPTGRLAGVVAKAHGIVSVQKGQAAVGLDAWVAQAGRTIVDAVVEWGREHLIDLGW